MTRYLSTVICFAILIGLLISGCQKEIVEAPSTITISAEAKAVGDTFCSDMANKETLTQEEANEVYSRCAT